MINSNDYDAVIVDGFTSLYLNSEFRSKVDFPSKEFADYKKAIESYYRESLDDIPSRIRMVNNRNAFLNNYYCSLVKYSYVDYFRMVHSIMHSPLSESMSATSLKEKSKYNKRIYLVGSFLPFKRTYCRYY